MSWWNSSWTYRKKLTFDNSGQAENLVHFPVLVKLDTANFDFSKAQSAGQDIRFVDSDDSTVLKHEIEKWTANTEAWIWVKVPQIDASSTTDFIYMYFGNAGASDAQDAENVWDSNFKAVWHLNGTSGSELDLTGNNNDGTVNGATRGQTGKVNSAFGFDGVDDNVTVSDATSIQKVFDSGGTLEAIIKPDSGGEGDYGRIMDKERPGTDGWFYFIYSESGGNVRQRLTVRFDGGTDGSWYTGRNVPIGQYSCIAVTYNSSNVANVPVIYLNGVSQTLASTQPVGTRKDDTGNNLIIGNRVDGDYTFDGIIDEVRISNTIRSANWIKAQCLSITLAFITFGGEEANLIKTEAGFGVEAAALNTVLISGDGGIGSDIGLLLKTIFSSDEGSGYDALKALIGAAGSDMRLHGRPGQVRMPSKGVNL